MRCKIAILCALAFVSAANGADTAELQTSASAAMAKKDYPAAVLHIDEALDLEPDNAYSLYLMSLAMLDGGYDLDGVERYLDKAKKAGAQPQAVQLLRARLFTKRNRLDEALEQIEALADSGYAQLARLDDQPDFDRLRGNTRYQEARHKVLAARYPCEADTRHSDFDFWVGDWNVYQNGVLAGTNRISEILGGCLIFEQWESVSGGLGKSFNYFDPARNHWRQIWVADSGTIIEFTGEARDGGVFYKAETVDPDSGELTHHRFEFTPHVEGGVRQYWAVSSDKEEWSTIWDGHYVRKVEDEARTSQSGSN